MADYRILRDEVVNDPLGLGYAGMTNAQVADSLNTQNRAIQRSRFVTARTLLNELVPTDAAAILDALNSATASNSVVKWAFSFLTSDSGIDVAAPNTALMLTSLVTSGVLTQSQSDAITALGNVTVSRSTEIGFDRVVTVEDVVRVRT